MMDNYPPGAANDPNAPYNETLAQEVDVTVRTKLTKDTCIFADTHDCVEWEIDPDMTRRRAVRRLNNWLKINPRLADFADANDFTPSQVALIVSEVGEPYR